MAKKKYIFFKKYIDDGEDTIDGVALPAMVGSAYQISDSKGLIVKTISDSRGAPPKKSPVPKGPVIQENQGSKAPARTYQDLLTNP